MASDKHSKDMYFACLRQRGTGLPCFGNREPDFVIPSTTVLAQAICKTQASRTHRNAGPLLKTDLLHPACEIIQNTRHLRPEPRSATAASLNVMNEGSESLELRTAPVVDSWAAIDLGVMDRALHMRVKSGQGTERLVT